MNSENLVVNRVKRQYFKPSMDGSWMIRRYKRQYFKPAIDGNVLEKSYIKERLAKAKSKVSNEVKLLRFNKWNELNKKKPRVVNYKQRNIESQMMDPNEMTVTSLGLSLISLFDRLKETLCDMIKHDCSKLQ